jgi:hypothetical protein
VELWGEGKTPEKSWDIMRRFKDFDVLHKHLQKQVGGKVTLPPLPPKHKLFEHKLFGSNDMQWIEQRKYACVP